MVEFFKWCLTYASLTLQIWGDYDTAGFMRAGAVILNAERFVKYSRIYVYIIFSVTSVHLDINLLKYTADMKFHS